MNKELPIIKLYKGFATNSLVFIHGHLFKSVSPQRDKLTRNPFKNALAMYRRYNVKPGKFQDVLIKINKDQHTVQTNKKGYFSLRIQHDAPDQVNYSVALQNDSVEEKDTILVDNPDQLIISDIDDTLLISHSTSLLKKLYLLLTKNHESRKTFKGIRTFYQQLEAGSATSYFYVSSSEWNLYDFLQSFISFNKLPNGVLLLQNIKSGLLDLFKSGGGSHMHKLEKIEQLIEMFEDIPVILVGDSGQKDPLIYKEIALKHTNRISAIYIRDIRRSKTKLMEKLIADLESKKIKMHLFKDS